MHINLKSWCMYTSRKIYNLELNRLTPWQTIWKLDTYFFFSSHGFRNHGDNLYLLPEAFYWWVLGTILFPSRAYFGVAPGNLTCHLLWGGSESNYLAGRYFNFVLDIVVYSTGNWSTWWLSINSYIFYGRAMQRLHWNCHTSFSTVTYIFQVQ